MLVETIQSGTPALEVLTLSFGFWCSREGRKARAVKLAIATSRIALEQYRQEDDELTLDERRHDRLHRNLVGAGVCISRIIEDCETRRVTPKRTRTLEVLRDLRDEISSELSTTSQELRALAC